MNDIISQSELFQKMIGKQKIIKSKKYRRFQYTVISNNDVMLAYNLLTLQLVEISQCESEFLNKQSVDFSENAISLIENWFLVPDDFNDMLFYRQYINILSQFKKIDCIRSYIIMPTTDCNARCFYCYEKELRRVNMNDTTAHKLAEYISIHSRGKKVYLSWFGGEPLYNKNAIDIICSDLKNSGTTFISKIITNGYLFDDDIILDAVRNWNLKTAQITLDGTEKVYNKTKNYIYQNVNPFYRVCNNIKSLLNAGVNVNIRINLGIHNRNDIMKLCDYIIDKFSGSKKLRVYVMPLYDFENTRSTSENKILVDDIIRIESKLNKYNLVRTYLPRELSIRNCMADDSESTLVNPEGKLGMCEHYSDTEIWGSIFDDDLVNKDVIESWYDIYDAFPECANCPFVPACIKVNKCPETKHICDNEFRRLKLYRLNRAMIGEWKKKGKENNFDSDYINKINLL